MTLEVWPHISPEELQIKAAESLVSCAVRHSLPAQLITQPSALQDRELEWIVQETMTLCHELKHGIEDCYALLAPIEPGSTLVMSTHRNEKVKGTITRVGTRLVKGVRRTPFPPKEKRKTAKLTEKTDAKPSAANAAPAATHHLAPRADPHPAP